MSSAESHNSHFTDVHQTSSPKIKPQNMNLNQSEELAKISIIS